MNDRQEEAAGEGDRAGEEASSEREPTLARGYGEDRIVAIPRGPETLFVYWDLTGPGAGRVRQLVGEGCEWVLGITDTTTGSRLDVPVDPQAGNHYLTLKAGTCCIVELGVLAGGRLHSVCRSAECKLPSDEPHAGPERRSGCGPGTAATSLPGLVYDPAFRSASSSSSSACRDGR